VDNGDGTITFKGNDIPPHDTWVFPRKTGNPFPIKESNWTMKINKEPIMRKTPLRCLPHGPIAVSTTGISIDTNWPSEKKCPFVPGFEELDICDGHPSPHNSYHHHYYAHCIEQPVCGEPSQIVGVAMDGIPIYGPFDETGRQLASEDTDECGGRYDADGRYKYHMTIDPPFFIDCLMGEIRNDIGLNKDLFFCSCPFDDSALGDHGPEPKPCDNPPCPKPPGPEPGPRPKRDLYCDFSGPSDGMAICEDKYNTSADMGVEWVRTKKVIDLAPCCPKGKDCGYSCKTLNGTNPECYVEQREVAFITTEEKGFCNTRCTAECTKEEVSWRPHPDPRPRPDPRPHPDDDPRPHPDPRPTDSWETDAAPSTSAPTEVTDEPKPNPTEAPKPDPRCMNKCMSFCKQKKGQNN